MQGAESIKTMEGKFSKITSSWLKMQKTIPISMDMISANFSREELELLKKFCMLPLGLWNWRSVLLWKRALAIFKDRMTISMDPIFFCVCLPNDQQSLLRLLSSVSLRHEADFTKENTYHFCRPRTSEQCYRPFITHYRRRAWPSG